MTLVHALVDKSLCAHVTQKQTKRAKLKKIFAYLTLAWALNSV